MDDIQSLLMALRQTPKILSELVKSLPQERMDVRRGAGFWTIDEHISHLAQVQPMLLKRLERFMNEDHPEFVPYLPDKANEEPGAPPCISAASALDQFKYYRDKQLQLLETADDVTWQKTATHPEYELYSFHILVRHILTHDYWHMYRMEELWLTRDAYLTKLE
jgi:hypothetical protein